MLLIGLDTAHKSVFFFKGYGDPRDLPFSPTPRSPDLFAYEKFNRRAQDWATVGIAAVASNGGAKVALTSMGATPLRASAVEQALAGGAAPAEAAEIGRAHD